MKYHGRDKILWLNMVALMLAFISVGALFIAIPDEVVAFTVTLGQWFGDFADPPKTGFRVWLSLGSAYMVLVSALAYLIQKDLYKNRGLILILALGKFTSSFTCLMFYLFSLDAFAYLLNFVIDGGIVLNLMVIYFLLGTPKNGTFPAERNKSFQKASKGHEILTAVLATLLPDPPNSGTTHQEISEDRLDEQVLHYFRELNPRGPLFLLLTLYAIEYGTLPWKGTLRPFTRLTPRERENYLCDFENSRWYFRQRILFSIRFLATVLFFSQPHREIETGYETPKIDRSNVGVY